jgi:large subunit ribosomal protein L14
MIYPGTKLYVSDNSGASIVKCIRVLGRSGNSHASIGDFIVVAVNLLKKRGNLKVKKKEVCLAIVLGVNKPKKRFDGRSFILKKNTCVLLNYKKVMYGTRLFGPIMKEFKTYTKHKLLSVTSQHF